MKIQPKIIKAGMTPNTMQRRPASANPQTKKPVNKTPKIGYPKGK